MIPRFRLARPTSLGEAFDAYTASDGDAAWYAGGTELLQVMKLGLAQVGTLIDLKRLPDLRGISVEPDGWLRIGAGVSHREIERSQVVRAELPAFVELESQVANPRVRNQGTIGGNLCFAEPHSDPATLLLACGAILELRGPGGSRMIPAAEFFLEPLVTAREADEILVAIRIPPAAPGEGRAYRKLRFRERPAVSVAVRVRLDAGVIREAHVAVGSMTDVPIEVPAAAAALVGAGTTPAALASSTEAGARAFDDLDAVADLDGSPEYKRHLAGVLLRRAVGAAVAEAADA
jgi:carbon-monoxide dehydrogenase medium subunit